MGEEKNTQEEKAIEEIVEEVKEEKSKKAKKEKPKKEKKVKKVKEEGDKPKKKGSKKFIALLILLIVLAGGLFAAYKMIPIIMGDKGEAYTVQIRMNYKKNLLYNKYPVTVYFNNQSIGSLNQGEDLEYATTLHNGSYVITFTDSNDAENTISGIVQVDGDTNYQYKLKADWKGITFSDSQNPIGFKDIEGAVKTEEVTEDKAEETKEETPAEEVPAEEAETKEQ